MPRKINRNLQQTMVRRWRHLQEKIESWDKGGTQDSMGMTLAVTHYITLWNLKRSSPATSQKPQWSNRETI